MLSSYARTAWIACIALGVVCQLASTARAVVEQQMKASSADIEDAVQLLNIIWKPREPTLQKKLVDTGFGEIMSSFSWKDCGKSTDAFHLWSLYLSPSPLQLPGNVTVGFLWNSFEDIKGPISMDIALAKWIGFFWYWVPCDKIPGTCHHADICQELASLTCPEQYEDCHCPIKKGEHMLMPTTIMVQQGGVPSGDYWIRATLKQDNQELGCVYAEVSAA